MNNLNNKFMEQNSKNIVFPSNTKSFKPLRQIKEGGRGYELRKIAQMTLGSGNMSLAVELPSGEDLNEWLAVNTIEFYNEISLLYGTLMEFCTQESCPIMSAGPK